jgi:hypothetical protein
MSRLRAALTAAFFALSCSQSSPPASSRSATLPAGALARAGSELVSAATVSRVAAAQGVLPRQAAELAVSDALFAHAARATLPLAAARSLERAAVARSLLEEIAREADRAGPPTAQELGEVAAERWTELNRPDAVRTTHAVVINDKPERDAAARALAEKLAASLGHATSSDELIKQALAFPAEGFEIRAEPLPFVTADGRVLQRRDAGFVPQRGGFDPDFARAANAIAQAGQLSPVVKSAFGYHVIRLDERAAGAAVPAAELPSLLAREVIQRRAARARGELLERLKAGTPVQVERAADDLTARVKVAP